MYTYCSVSEGGAGNVVIQECVSQSVPICHLVNVISPLDFALWSSLIFNVYSNHCKFCIFAYLPDHLHRELRVGLGWSVISATSFSSQKCGLVPMSGAEPGRVLSRADGQFRMSTLAVVWQIKWMGEMMRYLVSSLVRDEIWGKAVAAGEEESMDPRNIKEMGLKGLTNSFNSL